jgi:hypothetical protein
MSLVAEQGQFVGRGDSGNRSFERWIESQAYIMKVSGGPKYPLTWGYTKHSSRPRESGHSKWDSGCLSRQ